MPAPGGGPGGFAAGHRRRPPGEHLWAPGSSETASPPKDSLSCLGQPGFGDLAKKTAPISQTRYRVDNKIVREMHQEAKLFKNVKK